MRAYKAASDPIKTTRKQMNPVWSRSGQRVQHLLQLTGCVEECLKSFIPNGGVPFLRDDPIPHPSSLVIVRDIPFSDGAVATRNETASFPRCKTRIAGKQRGRRFGELLEDTLEGFEYVYPVAGGCVAMCDLPGSSSPSKPAVDLKANRCARPGRGTNVTEQVRSSDPIGTNKGPSEFPGLFKLPSQSGHTSLP
jgi:hypothetical protein